MKNIKFLEDNGVNIKQSLDLFGDYDTYNDTIGEFLIGIHNKINKLISFMQKQDMANYAIYAHSMKSDAAYFGFTKLSEMAKEHELHSKAGDMYFVTEHINDLIQETNNAILLIQEYMDDKEVPKKQEEKHEKEENDKEDIYDKKTILVVDDSNIVRNFVKRIFSENYNVGTAKDGEEAIKIIKANQDNNFIETILLDLNMPKVDGFAVLNYMQENNLFNEIPVSIISGDSSKETIDKAFKFPIIDMLSKPFSEQSVKMVIDKTLIYKDMI